MSGVSYNKSTHVWTVSTGTKTADIQAAIDSAAAGDTIYFAAGTHTLTDTLVIRHDGIAITGAGEDLTTLKLDVSKAGGEAIVYKGEGADWTGGLSKGVSEGATKITLADASGLKTGDVLYLSAANTAEFLASGLYDNILDSPYTADSPLRESYVEIASISGNVVTLAQPVAYDMGTSETTVQRLDLLKGASISDLTVTTNLSAADPYYFENEYEQYSGESAITGRYVYNMSVSNVRIVNPVSNGLELRGAFGGDVDGLEVTGAHNKGGEGNGYGLYLAETFYGNFENLTMTDVRHAVVFSSWSAEIGNNVHVLWTNRDINYHGSPDHSNTVLVDRVEYDAGSDRAWPVVGTGSVMHPWTDIHDNTTLFRYAQGSFKDEEIVAQDGGSTLYGNGGHDLLIGGTGADFLYGGEGNDTIRGNEGADEIDGGAGNDILSGGSGRDVFVKNYGEGADVVTDFLGWSNGDALALVGYYGVSKVSDLVMNQIGDDVEIVLARGYRIEDSILLKNVTISSLGEENFLFLDPGKAALSVDLSSGDDVIYGSGKADIISSTISHINAGDIVRAGAGTDTLAMVSSSFTLVTAGLDNVKGIDIIDVSAASSARLVLDDAFVARSDTGSIRVISDDDGIDRIDTSAVAVEHEVFVAGSGAVVMANVENNAISVDDAFAGTLKGGKYGDTITVRGGGATLKGYEGDDTFLIRDDTTARMEGGDGDDIFSFVSDSLRGTVRVSGGAGTADQLRFGQTVNVTAADLAGVSGIEILSFRKTGSSADLTDGMFGGDALEVRGHTGGILSAMIDISGLSGDHTIVLGRYMNLTVDGSHSGNIDFRIDETARGYLSASNSADTITGSSLNDRIYGNGGNDTIAGGAGNDRLSGGGGRDIFEMTLGDGRDTITDFQTGASGDRLDLTGYYHLRSFSDLDLVQVGSAVRLDLNANDSVTFEDTNVAAFTADNFRFDNSVIFDLTLRTTNGEDRIITGGGNDTVLVWVSNLDPAVDVFDLGAGTDSMIFQTTEAFTFNAARFSLMRGIEILDVSAAQTGPSLVISDSLAGDNDRGELTILYGAGGIGSLDTSRVDADHNVILIGSGAVTLADGADNRVVFEAGQSVNLTGGDGGDYVRLRGGSATLVMGDGNDTVAVTGDGVWNLRGGNGDDIFQFFTADGLAGQRVRGDSGYDEVRLYETANYDASDLANVSGIESIKLYEDGNMLELFAGLFGTRLTIGGNNGLVDAWIDMTGLAEGQTLVIDRDINAYLTGSSGVSYTIETTSSATGTVTATAGHDTITCGSADDVLYGMGGNDFLYGGYGDDRIEGGSGNDYIEGGRGADILSGGTGDDVFAWVNVNDLGDIIEDFEPQSGGDALDLSALFEANRLGSQTVDSAFDGGFLRWRDVADGVQLQVDLDGAAKATKGWVTIATLDGLDSTEVSHDVIRV